MTPTADVQTIGFDTNSQNLETDYASIICAYLVPDHDASILKLLQI